MNIFRVGCLQKLPKTLDLKEKLEISKQLLEKRIDERFPAFQNSDFVEKCKKLADRGFLRRNETEIYLDWIENGFKNTKNNDFFQIFINLIKDQK